MRLKSKNDFPPNGWAFFQAETGWKPTPYMSFQDTVMEIAAHRRANPRFNLPTDTASVSYDLEQYTVARLLSIPDGNRFLLTDDNPAPPSFPNRQPIRQRLAEVVAGVKLKVAGIGVLKSWLGDGLKPVSILHAEQRGGICVLCPRNDKTSPTTETIGDMGVRLLEVANDMELKTTHDQELGMCASCGCALRLKIFAPINHILANTSDEVKAKLPSHCWILQEQAQLQAVQPT